MSDRALLKIGVIGALLTAICCFTPALVVLLGAVGLSAWVGWLDHVLLPALIVFLGIIGVGLYLKSRAENQAGAKPGTSGTDTSP